MNRESYVKSQLEEFVRKHDPDSSISCIDEIVLSYMVSVLEELGSQHASDDAFDVEDFTQMMEAYLPAFAEIESVVVSEWMFDLAQKLSTFDELLPNGVVKDDSSQPVDDRTSLTLSGNSDLQCQGENAPESLPFANSSCRQRTISSHSSSSFEGQNMSRKSSVSSDSQEQCSRSRKRSSRQSSTSEVESQASGDAVASAIEETFDDDEQIRMLLEMFPAACSIEATHCLAVSSGDLEQAAQLMLHRQETGDSITQAATREKKTRSKKKVLPESLNDSDMKKHIVARYSYVDVDDDKKEHKPVVKPQGSKKLVRYLDGRIVSTRGEKFTEIKNDEDDEKMKKTYVNLKPARKYRFH